MKLSQPKSARIINRSRVLQCLRTKEGLSKASLARELGLNKVSVGEIVDTLINENLVQETGKLESSNGRKATSLSLIPNSRFVLAVSIEKRFTTVALCNNLCEIINFERIPTETKTKTVEQFCVDIIKSSIRITKLVDKTKILGTSITINGKVSLDSKIIEECIYLPWKNIQIAKAFEQVLKVPTIVNNSTAALVLAERIVSSKTDLLKSEQPLLYIDWGDSLAMCQVLDTKPYAINNEFAHLKVSPKGLCTCGDIGCLEANVSPWALSGKEDVHLKDLWDKIDERAISLMSNAIEICRQITGSTKVVISGEGSTITDTCLNFLRVKLSKMTIERSMLGEKANIISCAEAALDKWLYCTTIIETVKGYL